MFAQILTIGRNTFMESIRQPIFTVLMIVGALAISLNPSLAAYTLDDDNKILIEVGLSTLFLIGLFLAAFTATGVVSTEVENKTALTVISKPVSKPTFVAGKYLGVSAAIFVAFWTLSMMFLLSLRHRVMQTASDSFDGPVILFGVVFFKLALLIAAGGNYMYRWPFTSTFIRALTSLMTLGWILVLLIDREWHFQPPWQEFIKENSQLGQIMLGQFLIFQAILIITAIAIAASTRLGQVMNLVICIVVFFAGLISDYFNYMVDNLFSKTVKLSEYSMWQRPIVVLGADASPSAKCGYLAAKLVHYLTPNLQFFWPADALTQGHGFDAAYIGWVSLYAFLMIAAILGLATSLFQSRELG